MSVPIIRHCRSCKKPLPDGSKRKTCSAACLKKARSHWHGVRNAIEAHDKEVKRARLLRYRICHLETRAGNLSRPEDAEAAADVAKQLVWADNAMRVATKRIEERLGNIRHNPEAGADAMGILKYADRHRAGSYMAKEFV